MAELNLIHNRKARRVRETTLPKAKKARGITRKVLGPAGNTRLFGRVTGEGVYLWSSAIPGDHFRLSVSDPNGGPGDRMDLAESATAWLVDTPYLHTHPPFGSPHVVYYLHVRREDQLFLAGTAVFDLTEHVLTRPVIDAAASTYNHPYVHLEWTWDGEPAELERFQCHWRDPLGANPGQRFPLEQTAAQNLDVTLSRATALPAIAVEVIAVGKRLLDSPPAEHLLNNLGGPAAGKRSAFDHRQVTPNLVLNSSFEFHRLQQGETYPEHWELSADGLPSPRSRVEPAGTWTGGNPHGDWTLILYPGDVLRQWISVRMSNTDFHSISLESRDGGGRLLAVTEDGQTLASMALGPGLNRLENLRVPADRDGFWLEIHAEGGSLSADRVMAHQGSTVDPWAPARQDALLARLADAETITQQGLDDLNAVIELLGGQSGSVIHRLDSEIDVIVANLEGDSQSFAWIQLTANRLQQIVQDLYVNGDPDNPTQIALARTEIDQHAEVLFGENGLSGLVAAVNAQTSAIDSLEQSMSVAQTGISQLSGITTNPQTGGSSQNLWSGINLNAASIQSTEAQLAGAVANISALTGIVNHPETGNQALRSQILFNASTLSQELGPGGRLSLAEAGIALNTQIAQVNQQGLVDTRAEVVVKAQAAGNGEYSLALVALDASPSSGSTLTLSADSMNVDAVVTFINSQAGTGTTTIDGGAIHASSRIRIGGPTQYFDFASGGILSHDGKVSITTTGIFSTEGGPSGQCYFGLGRVFGPETTANLLKVWDAGGTATLTGSELSFAPNLGLQFPNLTPETDGEPELQAYSAALAAAKPAWKISARGLEYLDESGAVGAALEAPQSLNVAVDLSTTPPGGTYTATVAIRRRCSAGYGVLPNPAAIHLGFIDGTGGGPPIPVLAPITIGERSEERFRFAFPVFEVSTLIPNHQLQFQVF